MSVYYVDDEIALEDILEINSKLVEPLTEEEVIKATSSATIGAKEKRYKYSNDKLIKLLDITPLEQKQMVTIISRSEKYYRNNEKRKLSRRNDQGLTKREVEKLDKINKIQELKSKDYNNSEIATMMKMSRRQVIRYLNEAREI